MTCNDQSESAQFKPLICMPQQACALQVPDEVDGY